MVLCISSSLKEIEQTVNTLKFGLKAKKVVLAVDRRSLWEKDENSFFIENEAKINELQFELENKEKQLKDIKETFNSLLQMVLLYQNKNQYGLLNLNPFNLKEIQKDLISLLLKQKEQEALFQLDLHSKQEDYEKKMEFSLEEVRFFNKEFYFDKDIPQEQDSTLISLGDLL